MPISGKIVLFLLACASIPAGVYGQAVSSSAGNRTPLKVAPRMEPAPTAEISFGYRLHTDGWSAYMDYGMMRSSETKDKDKFYNTHILQFELSEKKHPKQEKLTVQDMGGNTLGKYVFGKINNFYAVKGGYGYRKMIAGKPDPGSVSIHWTSIIGPSLGLLKPYYLNLDGLSGANGSIKYSDDTRPKFLNQQLIIGGAGFSKGLSEMKPIPGAHFKTMLHFDFAADKHTVLAVETGVDIEYYAEPIPILYNREAQSYFASLFMSVQFGKRW